MNFLRHFETKKENYLKDIKVVGNYMIYLGEAYPTMGNLVLLNKVLSDQFDFEIRFDRIGLLNTKYRFEIQIDYKDTIYLNLDILVDKKKNVHGELYSKLFHIDKLLKEIVISRPHKLHIYSIKYLKILAAFTKLFNYEEFKNFNSEYLNLNMKDLKILIEYRILNPKKSSVLIDDHRFRFSIVDFVDVSVSSDTHIYIMQEAYQKISPHSTRLTYLETFKLILYFAHKQKATKFLDQLEKALICQPNVQ